MSAFGSGLLQRRQPQVSTGLRGQQNTRTQIGGGQLAGLPPGVSGGGGSQGTTFRPGSRMDLLRQQSTVRRSGQQGLGGSQVLPQGTPGSGIPPWLQQQMNPGAPPPQPSPPGGGFQGNRASQTGGGAPQQQQRDQLMQQWQNARRMGFGDQWMRQHMDEIAEAGLSLGRPEPGIGLGIQGPQRSINQGGGFTQGQDINFSGISGFQNNPIVRQQLNALGVAPTTNGIPNSPITGAPPQIRPSTDPALPGVQVRYDGGQWLDPQSAMRAHMRNQTQQQQFLSTGDRSPVTQQQAGTFRLNPPTFGGTLGGSPGTIGGGGGAGGGAGGIPGGGGGGFGGGQFAPPPFGTTQGGLDQLGGAVTGGLIDQIQNPSGLDVQSNLTAARDRTGRDLRDEERQIRESFGRRGQGDPDNPALIAALNEARERGSRRFGEDRLGINSQNRSLQLQNLIQSLSTGANFLGQRGGQLGQGELLQLLLQGGLF